MMNKITLITTVLNDEKGLGDLFEGLSRQSLQPDEIVVVDGGSKDTTWQLLHDYQHQFPQLKIVQAPGTNISEGRNIAISHATNPLIAVTDAGCRPASDWLLEITRPLLEHADVDAVSGQVKPETHSLLEHYCGLLSLPDHSTEEQSQLFYGRSSAFRRTVWEQVGGYPEWLYTAEDSLFALAAKHHGFKAVHNAKAIVLWRPRSTLKKIAKMFYLYGKGNGRIVWGDIKGTFYWLRNHALFWLSVLAGLWFPPLWLATLVLGAHLYRHIAYPSLLTIRKLDKDWRREIFVPLITYIRNLSTNLGYLSGFMEYKKNPLFKEKLDKYLAH